MVTKFEEIVSARIAIGAPDTSYGVQFAYEIIKSKTWEFDPNSDAVGQYTTKRTGRIKVFFNPVENTMKFPEDAGRPRAYIMSIEKARDMFKFLTNGRNPNYWFALDMADLASAASM